MLGLFKEEREGSYSEGWGVGGGGGEVEGVGGWGGGGVVSENRGTEEWEMRQE